MPHEELREKNIRLVIENALDSFLENGIEKTKVADVARRSGLTERSVFRYFETKADLVLAASLLYWNRILALIDRMSHENSDGGTTGLEDAANVLVCYSMLYHLDPKGMRFTLDAELTLQAAGRLHEIKNQPPEPFETSRGPNRNYLRADVREIYYNSYDAILGIMQRLSIGGSPSARELDYDSRMLHLSEMFVKALSGK
ncbi:MAG: hypothetical protein BHW36_11295 [Firmicutes bacterium CAG:24053_14]|nr:MAG: hypothetical protein BHW36_11295 [Firmicutes bacterium CAG:24053_14]